MKEICCGEQRRWETWTAKKWRSQQIDIMLREWMAGDLEWLVRRGEKEEKRWRIFVLFTYWYPGCMITIHPQSHRLSLSSSIFLSPLFSVFCPLSSSVFLFLLLCLPLSSSSRCHITTWWERHSFKCVNPWGLGSDCTSMLCSTMPNLLFNKNMLFFYLHNSEWVGTQIQNLDLFRQYFF